MNEFQEELSWLRTWNRTTIRTIPRARHRTITKITLRMIIRTAQARTVLLRTVQTVPIILKRIKQVTTARTVTDK